VSVCGAHRTLALSAVRCCKDPGALGVQLVLIASHPGPAEKHPWALGPERVYRAPCRGGRRKPEKRNLLAPSPWVLQAAPGDDLPPPGPPASVVRAHGKERKKTLNPREGWEDGTPPPHRDFKGRGVVLAVAHPNPWSSASSYLPSQSLADSRCKHQASSNLEHLACQIGNLFFTRSGRRRARGALWSPHSCPTSGCALHRR